MKTTLFSLAIVGLLLVVPAANAANSLAVTGAAALNGSSWGLATTTDLSTNDVYVSSQHPADEATYNASFYINPGTLPNDSLISDFMIGFIKDSIGGDDPETKWFIPIILRRQNSFWTLQTNIREDDDTFPNWNLATKICGDVTTTIPCSNFANGVMFELKFTASSGPGNNDGTYEVYKNGQLKASWNGLDTDNRRVTEIRWGAIFQGNAANRTHAAGTYYFDEFVSTR